MEKTTAQLKFEEKLKELSPKDAVVSAYEFAMKEPENKSLAVAKLTGYFFEKNFDLDQLYDAYVGVMSFKGRTMDDAASAYLDIFPEIKPKDVITPGDKALSITQQIENAIKNVSLRESSRLDKLSEVNQRFAEVVRTVTEVCGVLDIYSQAKFNTTMRDENQKRLSKYLS